MQTLLKQIVQQQPFHPCIRNRFRCQQSWSSISSKKTALTSWIKCSSIFEIPCPARKTTKHCLSACCASCFCTKSMQSWAKLSGAYRLALMQPSDLLPASNRCCVLLHDSHTLLSVCCCSTFNCSLLMVLNCFACQYVYVEDHKWQVVTHLSSCCPSGLPGSKNSQKSAAADVVQHPWTFGTSASWTAPWD